MQARGARGVNERNSMKRTSKTSKQPSRAVPPLLAGLVGVTLMITVAWLAVNQTRAKPLASGRYWRSGQWRADVRTLVATVDFLVTPDSGSQPRPRTVVTNTVAAQTNTPNLRVRAGLTEEQLEALRAAMRVRLLS